MIRVIDTVFEEGAVQADGRRYVKERHTLSDGQQYSYEFLADETFNLVMIGEERVRIIHAELEAREQARAFVLGTEVPHTKHDFLDRFSSVERQKVRERAKTDANVLDFMEMLAASGGVYKSKAWPGLAYLAHIEVLTWDRATAIHESM